MTALWATSGTAVCVGWISQVDQKGRPFVDFRGNKIGPVRARSVCGPAETSTSDTRREVLLVFEHGDPTLPIIVGFVREALFPVYSPSSAPEVQNKKPRTLTLEAQEYLELKCGKASITLTNDGRAEVSGKEVVSRASRTNKIRGASVQIN